MTPEATRPEHEVTHDHERDGERHLSELLDAFAVLSRRGVGVGAWAAPFRDDALAFLLDTVSDGARIWSAGGDLVYQNRAEEELGMGRRDETPIEAFSMNGRAFERRCTRCHLQAADYVLEIVREVRPR